MYMLLYYSDISSSQLSNPSMVSFNINDMYKMAVAKGGVYPYEGHEVK
jgi:hypothetical protein